MENIVNDFTINIATANGTGSQSTNLILLNLYSIWEYRSAVRICFLQTFQVCLHGISLDYPTTAMRPGNRTDVQVLVNPATWAEDLAALEPGTVVVWNENSSWKWTVMTSSRTQFQ